MAWLLILAVIAVPVIEIALFVKAVDVFGGLTTVLLALGAGFAGIILVRAQGLMTLTRVQAQIQKGELPVAEMLDGLFLAAAGGLLVLPGFLSDAVAILLILPPTRALIRLWLVRRLVVVQPGSPQGPTGPTGPTVIDGEFTVVEPEPPKRLD